jgi:hypothetical protein
MFILKIMKIISPKIFQGIFTCGDFGSVGSGWELNGGGGGG